MSNWHLGSVYFLRNITRKTFVAVDNKKKKNGQKPLAIIFHGVERSLFTTSSLFVLPIYLNCVEFRPSFILFFCNRHGSKRNWRARPSVCSECQKCILKNAWGRCLVSAVIAQLLETDRRSLVSGFAGASPCTFVAWLI